MWSIKALLSRFVESDLVLLVLVVLLVGGGYSLLRNGPEYFLGTSGGAYWDHIAYCQTHPGSQMKLYSLVSCQEILAKQAYCWDHEEEDVSIAKSTIACDVFLDLPEEEEPPPAVVPTPIQPKS